MYDGKYSLTINVPWIISPNENITEIISYSLAYKFYCEQCGKGYFPQNKLSNSCLFVRKATNKTFRGI